MPSESDLKKSDIVVVGAGIIGASVAFHLTLRGARVTLVDAGDAGAALFGQRSGCGLYNVRYVDDFYIFVAGKIGCVNLANSTRSNNGDTNHASGSPSDDFSSPYLYA